MNLKDLRLRDKMELGRLKKVDLRTAWKHEALDFTKWLSQENNINLLSDEIGMDIEVIQTEASVGKFNVDILAQEPNTNRKIIIENQLETTNHDHLGKLITYAAGHHAEIIIWIVKEVRSEHKQAIGWLNEHTDETANFFAIKMELWQIGNSPAAPKFQIIAGPNEWAKALKKASQSGSLTDTKLMQLEFWNKFKEYFESKNNKIRLRTPRPQHWYDLSFGFGNEAHMAVTMDTRKNLIGCEIYINSKNSKIIYEQLFQNKTKIESELGLKLEWMKLQQKKACRIKISKSANINDDDKWETYFDWLHINVEQFHKVFGKYFKKVLSR